MKKALLLLALLMAHGWASAQGGTAEMADVFRSNGKIFIVFAVIVTIFAGIVLYLVRLDRKLSRLEKQPYH
ncbi:CcmD family protein [Flaviaesturariibacter amylovorans]|uniref:CcmD family protein n=1 Tax=Flaviaesturariibacter amylovorans TaxID=1084520 RepID=A0ABP8GKE0_9BACT